MSTGVSTSTTMLYGTTAWARSDKSGSVTTLVCTLGLSSLRVHSESGKGSQNSDSEPRDCLYGKNDVLLNLKHLIYKF